MLATPQRFPRAGSQEYPSPAANTKADGSTTVYFSPKKPEGAPGKLDTDRSGEGLVRYSAALQPSRTVLQQELASERNAAC